MQLEECPNWQRNLKATFHLRANSTQDMGQHTLSTHFSSPDFTTPVVPYTEKSHFFSGLLGSTLQIVCLSHQNTISIAIASVTAQI